MIGGRSALVALAALAGVALSGSPQSDGGGQRAQTVTGRIAHTQGNPSVGLLMADATFDRWMRRASMTGHGGAGGLGGVHGPAGTNRGYQRAQRKARNRAANRRAHRG